MLSLSGVCTFGLVAALPFQELAINAVEDLNPVHAHMLTFGNTLERLADSLDVSSQVGFEPNIVS
jgi:hypothetical protein